MASLSPRDTELLARIRRRLQEGDLPGYKAQEIMGHALRKDYSQAPDNVRAASVLALLYPAAADASLQLLFIQRTSPPHDRHAGQISFPGGSTDPTDKDAAATALREAHEEVGIDPDQVELLGQLTPLYIPISNFLVQPFVGWLDRRPRFTLQESEVARILELPLAAFYAENVVEHREKKLFNGLILKDVPHWVIGNESVWGATAMMVGELVEIGRATAQD